MWANEEAPSLTFEVDASQWDWEDEEKTGYQSKVRFQYRDKRLDVDWDDLVVSMAQLEEIVRFLTDEKRLKNIVQVTVNLGKLGGQQEVSLWKQTSDMTKLWSKLGRRKDVNAKLIIIFLDQKAAENAYSKAWVLMFFLFIPAAIFKLLGDQGETTHCKSSKDHLTSFAFANVQNTLQQSEDGSSAQF